MFGPGMGRFFAGVVNDTLSEAPTYLRLRRGRLEFEAMRLLWSTWQQMCDFTNVGVDADKLCVGVFLDQNGEITSSANGNLGLRIPLIAMGGILAAEGDWIVKAPSGVLFPVPHARLENLFEIVEVLVA